MAFRHLKAAWRVKLDNSGLKLVLLALADMANDAGECWPSRGTLAEMCELDPNSIRRHIQTLRKKRLIEVRERFADNRQRSNLFRLIGETWVSPSPETWVSPRITSNEPPKTKEAKDDTFSEGACSFNAIWQPDTRSKEQKLQAIRPSESFPSEVEFEAYLEDECLDEVVCYRPDLYRELCLHKWHQWNQKLGKWVKIRNWHSYVTKLNEIIGDSKRR